MDFSFNQITRLPDLTGASSTSIPISSSDPSGASEGDLYVNSGNNTIYIYYGGSWQSTGIVLTPTAASLIDIEGSTDDLLMETSDQLVLEG